MLSWKEYRRNRKWEQELGAFFRKEDLEAPDARRKQQGLELLRREREKLRLMPRLSYGRRIWNQAAYISPMAWIAQGALVLFLGFLLGEPYREQWEKLLILASFAPVMGIVGFTELLRSYREEMWELEQACRYNLRQLMGMRLLIFGAVDALIAVLIFLSGIRMGILLEQLLLLYLVPQLLSDCVYLRLLTRFRGRFQGAALLGVAAGMTLLWMRVNERFVESPELLKTLCGSGGVLWVVILTFVSAGLLILCCVKFLNGVEKEDDRWNFGWIG